MTKKKVLVIIIAAAVVIAAAIILILTLGGSNLAGKWYSKIGTSYVCIDLKSNGDYDYQEYVNGKYVSLYEDMLKGGFINAKWEDKGDQIVTSLITADGNSISNPMTIVSRSADELVLEMSGIQATYTRKDPLA